MQGRWGVSVIGRRGRGFISRGPSSGIVRGRNVILLFDTAINALAGLALMMIAARSLSPGALAEFAVGQMIIVLAIGMLRGALWGPALAAQRKGGRSTIPSGWPLAASAMSVPFLHAALSLFVGGGGQRTAAVYLLIWFLASWQDGLRTVCASRGRVRRMFAADIASAVSMVGLAILLRPTAATLVLFAWGVSCAIGIVIMLAAPSMWVKGDRLRSLHLRRETWRLGRWALIDGLLASAASLAPIYASFQVMASDDAGVYRVLLTAVGPLNVVHTTLITTYGLDAWQLRDEDALRTLRRRTLRSSIVLGLVSTAYLAFSLPVVASVTGLSSGGPKETEMLVVGVYGVLTGMTAPLVAGALALGYHRHGVLIRLPCLLAAVLVSTVPLWGQGSALDPIGVALAVTAAIAYAGWAISFFVGSRRELVGNFR